MARAIFVDDRAGLLILIAAILTIWAVVFPDHFAATLDQIIASIEGYL